MFKEKIEFWKKISQGFPKKISQFGSAVWPALALTYKYINMYIYERIALLYRYISYMYIYVSYSSGMRGGYRGGGRTFEPPWDFRIASLYHLRERKPMTKQ